MQINTKNYNSTFCGTVTTPGVPSEKYKKAVYPYIQKMTETNYDFCITEKLSDTFCKHLKLTVSDNGKTIFTNKPHLFESYQTAIENMLKKLKIY